MYQNARHWQITHSSAHMQPGMQEEDHPSHSKTTYKLEPPEFLRASVTWTSSVILHALLALLVSTCLLCVAEEALSTELWPVWTLCRPDWSWICSNSPASALRSRDYWSAPSTWLCLTNSTKHLWPGNHHLSANYTGLPRKGLTPRLACPPLPSIQSGHSPAAHPKSGNPRRKTTMTHSLKFRDSHGAAPVSHVLR